MSAPNNTNIFSYIEIVEKGKLFSSPEERYGSAVQIVCDRCQATPIKEGYGFGNSDICFLCANRVLDFLENLDSLNLTMMEQEQFGETRGGNSQITLMAQNQFVETRGGNSPITFMMQDQFIKPRGGNTTDSFITTNMQQGIYWRTKMTTRMFDALEGKTPNPGRGGGDELQRKLEEMQRLREQPISRLSDDDGIMGYESTRIGGSSLDSQFGSLLSPQDKYPVASKIDNNIIQTKPKDSNKTSAVTVNPTQSRPDSSEIPLTSMIPSMYRTRMLSNIYTKKTD